MQHRHGFASFEARRRALANAVADASESYRLALLARMPLRGRVLSPHFSSIAIASRSLPDAE